MCSNLETLFQLGHAAALAGFLRESKNKMRNQESNSERP